MNIADFEFELHPDRPPVDWSMENDYFRQVEQLDEHTHCLVTWMGRVFYVVECSGKAVVLPLMRALGVSQVISADDAARRAAYEAALQLGSPSPG